MFVNLPKISVDEYDLKDKTILVNNSIEDSIEDCVVIRELLRHDPKNIIKYDNEISDWFSAILEYYPLKNNSVCPSKLVESLVNNAINDDLYLWVFYDYENNLIAYDLSREEKEYSIVDSSSVDIVDVSNDEKYFKYQVMKLNKGKL